MPGRFIDTPEGRVNARLGRVLQQPRCSTRGGRRPSSGAEKKERDGGEPLSEPAQPEEAMSDSAARRSDMGKPAVLYVLKRPLPTRDPIRRIKIHRRPRPLSGTRSSCTQN